MFKRVLIANRGEIALRIIRCCRELGIETVIVYSTADEQSLAVQFATHAVCIGPAKASESYLNQEGLIEVALKMECDAIHPGFGFLSENAEFARKCEAQKLIFIGPKAETIQKMGDKKQARKLMLECQVPIVPGSNQTLNTVEDACHEASKIGYPVLLKASAGGGGKGMRKAFNEEELRASFSMAKTESLAAFGNDDMYLEKLILNPHHIEFQILADNFGNCIHLGERDCSLQRRNQKLFEEAPSKFLSEQKRVEMGEVAIKAALAANYVGAGTIEFVMDDEMNYYFIEMNTRIQVEHGVTEMVTGIDLIKEQIRIAANQPLGITQEEVVLNGYSMECRILAEDPWNQFLPSPGKIDFVHFPGGFGVRIDSDLYSGCVTSPYYDSMIAKVIVHGKTRLEAIRRMRRALEELTVEGIKTNTDFMHLLLHHPVFMKGCYRTSFWDEYSKEILEWNQNEEDC